MTSPHLATPPSVIVLGYRLAAIDLDQATEWLLEAALAASDPRMVVTLNPEIVVRAQRDGRLHSAVQHADLVVADGVGMLWAARKAGHRLPGRVSGVELVPRTMARAGSRLRVFFLGGKPGVAERAAAAAASRWGTDVAGWHHGYFAGEDDVLRVVASVRSAKPNLLLAGLGEGQEEFLARHREALGVPAQIGVGGTLDILAGEARRTPYWTRRLGLEWAWRVGMDPRRWHRFPRLLQFIRLVRQHSRTS